MARHLDLRVAVFLLGLYLLTFSGHFHSIDEFAAHATIESIVREGDLSVEQFRWAENWKPTHVAIGRNQTPYSKRGIGYSLVFLPFWVLGRLLNGPGLVQMTAFAAVGATVATALLLMWTTEHLGASPHRAAAIGLLYGLASPAWPYGRFHLSEPFTALSWTAALWLIVRDRDRRNLHRTGLLNGLIVGAGVLVHRANFVALIVLGVWFAGRGMRGSTEKRWRGALGFVIGALPALLVLAGLNALRYGTTLTTGYTSTEERFIFDYVRSIPGLLISPGKGIIWFAPAAVLGLAGWHRFWKEHRPVAVLVLAWCLGALGVYGGWFMWWGGWSWGPRYLVPIVPLLLIPLIWYPTTRAATATLLGAGIVGTAINAAGALVDFNLPLTRLAQRGISDYQAIWRWSAWPALTHARLALEGRLDLAWWTPPVDWPIILAITTVTGTVLLLDSHTGPSLRFGRHRAMPYVLGSLLLLVTAGVGLRHETWNPTDAALRDVNAIIATEARQDDRVLVELVPYYDYVTTIEAWMNRYTAAPPYRTVVRGELLPGGIVPKGPTGRLWLVLERTPAGDPASETERALLVDEPFEMALLDERWEGDFRVVRLVPPPDTPSQPYRAGFANGVRLAATLDRRGDLLIAGLTWQPTAPIKEDLVVFVQFIASDGTLIAQHDRRPHNGLSPTTEWQPGTTISEAYALPYRSGGDVIVGLYDAATGERIALADGSADFARVGTVPQ